MCRHPGTGHFWGAASYHCCPTKKRDVILFYWRIHEWLSDSRPPWGTLIAFRRQASFLADCNCCISSVVLLRSLTENLHMNDLHILMKISTLCCTCCLAQVNPHMTPELFDLHWLPISFRVEFQVLALRFAWDLLMWETPLPTLYYHHFDQCIYLPSIHKIRQKLLKQFN